MATAPALMLARLTLREMRRRPGVLVLMVAMPLTFYLVNGYSGGFSIRLLSLGLAWAVSTLSLFTVAGSLGLDRRLRLSGWSVRSLLVGRAGAVAAVGLVLALAYALLIALRALDVRLWGVLALLVLAVLIGTALGTALGLLIARELEGALALLTILAAQFIADPAGAVAKVLPLWSVRELGTYAIDLTGVAYLQRGLVHAGGCLLLLTLAAAVLARRRLRLEPSDDPASAPDRVPDPVG